ncbi:hypothetical protein FACS1894132_02100 [Clostridia bacterium]|nr:hypothetical protein FACS1894132_02100 [Clostridia bacterium]
MDWWIFAIVALAVVIVVQAITKKPTQQKEVLEESNKSVQYKSKPFLTPNEKGFLAILRELAKHGLIVVPQVNLATVVQKVGEFRYQNELYRNIDFGVFDREYNLLLLIELNDASHQQSARRARDIKVKEIIKQAGLKLITFYTNMPNKPEYVVGRVLDELNTSKSTNSEKM